MKLAEAIKKLSETGVDNPAHDARALFAHFGGFSSAELACRDTECTSPALTAAVERRKSREPLQYIIGEVAFYKETYRVTPDCLIPRSDTELLVEYAVKHIPEGERFLDLCTGSGCIAVSVLKNTKDTECVAIDISEAALAIAAGNAESNGVGARLGLKRRDLLCEHIADSEEKYFAVLSNPPYIPSAVYEGLEREIFCEPRIAFVAEDGGAEFYKRLIPKGLSVLKDGGFLAFEIGYDQASLLSALAEEHCCDMELLRDYGGNDRVAILRPKRG